MLTEDPASVYYQYKEENGQNQKEESFKPKIDALRQNFDMACAAFDCIVDYDPEEGSAKRKLDMVMERLLNIKSMLNESTGPVDFRYRTYQNRLSEYEVTFASLMNTLTIQIDDFKNEVLKSIEVNIGVYNRPFNLYVKIIYLFVKFISYSLRYIVHAVRYGILNMAAYVVNI